MIIFHNSIELKIYLLPFAEANALIEYMIWLEDNRIFIEKINDETQISVTLKITPLVQCLIMK